MSRPPFDRYWTVAVAVIAGFALLLCAGVAIEYGKDPPRQPADASRRSTDPPRKPADPPPSGLPVGPVCSIGAVAAFLVLAFAAAFAVRAVADAYDSAAYRGEQESAARVKAEAARAAAELVVLRAGFGAVKSSDADLARAQAEVGRLTRDLAAARVPGKAADPERKDTLVRLMDARALAREDALFEDVDEYVREAKLNAIDAEFNPLIEAAYAAL